MTDTDWINEIEQLTDAATEGPWVYCYEGQCCLDDRCIDPVIHNGDLVANSNDAAFIAAAREAVPRLIAKVREQAAKLARVEALHQPSPEQVDDAGVAYRLCLHCTYINRYGRQRYPCPTVTALNERDDQ